MKTIICQLFNQRHACIVNLSLLVFLVMPSLATAAPLYWNTFNIEDESQVSAQFVTYASLNDMLNDENRLDVLTPDGFSDGSFGNNIVGAGSDGSTYWNTFNIEGESQVSAQFVTYASLNDMLNDENRLDVFTPDGFSDGSFGNNIVGSGSDGSSYWNVFNIEGESQVSAQFVTYASLNDMLNDENRLDVFTPDGFSDGSFGSNIVGSGSDGSSYWNVFNIEGESQVSAQFVTYASLIDMLNDENRLDVFTPDGFSDGSFGNNIVGSGALLLSARSVPEPSSLAIITLGLILLVLTYQRRRLCNQLSGSDEVSNRLL